MCVFYFSQLNLIRIKQKISVFQQKNINITISLYFSLSAVGIQMKLEFFQRKFWTASKQVHLQQTPQSNAFFVSISLTVSI